MRRVSLYKVMLADYMDISLRLIKRTGLIHQVLHKAEAQI